MWRQIKFNACAAIQVVVSVVRVSTVIVLGAHTQVIVVVQDIAAVAIGIGAATFTELGGILVLAIALEGLAVGERGALGLGNASCTGRGTAGRGTAISRHSFGVKEIICIGFDGGVAIGQLNAGHGSHSGSKRAVQIYISLSYPIGAAAQVEFASLMGHGLFKKKAK